jgi:transposase-like protein
MKTKMTTKKRKQKRFQPAEKVAIIREHLVEKKPVSDVCDQYGIHPSIYYRWQQQFFERGEKAFASTNEKQAVKQLKQEVTDLEAKLARKDEVLGEVMEEYVTLKKSVGER